ncbi:MAG: glycosyltransferase family 1 protein [Cyanobacteriota bacterium]
MRLGIDASNLRVGGGLTHLIELLKTAYPEAHGITRVVVWGNQKTLNQLPVQSWLDAIHVPLLDRGLPLRLYWQRFKLPTLAKHSCDLLFVPGGNYRGSFRPFVTMYRNMLLFDTGEMRRYGVSGTFLRLLLLRKAQQATFKQADALIFLTKHAQEIVQNSLGKLPGIPIIIPHGVNEQFRRKPGVQKEIGEYSLARPFRVLYVSIIDLYKHQWQVVEAVAQLRNKGIPITLDLVGSAYPPALIRLQKAMDQADPKGEFIRYLGSVPYSELPNLYHKGDAFVFASSCENMPNILLEAMASGLPIACSKRRPMPEILDEAGLYFDPEQPTEIAEALQTLIEQPCLRETLAMRAYNQALNYSWERCAKETFSFLAQVAQRVSLRD